MRIAPPLAPCLGALLAVFGGGVSCSQSGEKTAPAPSSIASASAPARGLSKEEAAQILARVGNVTITLGDYAAALERMDRYERLRYQSAERRQILLNEMIDLELLAQEAKRQKLDQSPEYRIALDRALRDEVLLDLRAKVPAPDALPAQEIRAHYDAHRADYQEPERRRVSAIVVGTEALAKSVLEAAKKASPTEFGELVRKHSLVRSTAASLPLELEGDLGIISLAPGTESQEPKLPEAVRKALFEIAKIGEVYGQPVAASGRFYLLRMTGRSEARTRSFAEAERSIRVRIVDERMAQAEQQLILQLKKETTITIDDAALAKLRLSGRAKEDKLRDALQQ